MRYRRVIKNLGLLIQGHLRMLTAWILGKDSEGARLSESGRRRMKKIRRLPFVFASFLLAGILAGSLFTLVLLETGRILLSSDRFLSSGARFVFGKSLALGGRAEDGSFVLSDFESPDSLKAWYAIGADIETLERYPSQGVKTMRVMFRARSRHSIVILDDLLKSRQGGSDWQDYKALAFTIYAPIKGEARLVLQITDLWGKQYRETLKFPGGRGVVFEIPVHRIEGVITASKIDTIAFWIQEESEDREFYFDDFRLIPKPPVPASVVKNIPERKDHESKGLDSRPVKLLDYGFQARKHAWTLGPSGPLKEIIRVPFGIKNETGVPCRLCPVEGAVPFPPGELEDLAKLRMRSPKGDELLFQPRVLATWPDGSVRWLGLHFEDGLMPGQGTGYFLDYGPGISRILPSEGIKVREEEDMIRIDTGPMRVVLNRDTFYLFDKLWIDENGDSIFEEKELRSEKAQIRLLFRAQEYRADLSRADYKIDVEENGPLRTVIRAEGWLRNKEGARFSKVILRYTFYQGKSHFKLAHTFIYTGYPANSFYGVYEDLKLPENEPVEMFGLRVPLKGPEKEETRVIRFGRLGAAPLEALADKPVRLIQTEYEQSHLKIGEMEYPNAGLFSGWADVSSPARGFASTVRRFRENFPKAFGYDPAGGWVDIDLWPAEQGPLDLSTTQSALGPDAAARGSAFGLGKTHELLLYFHKGDGVESAERMAGFSQRLLIRNNPYWVDATGVLGRLYPVDKRYQGQERMLENLFDWAARHPRYFRWYGMLNFGDTRMWWRNRDEDQEYEEYGWHPHGRWGWYNNEGVGTHTGALLQFVRSGHWKYFEFGENLARHIFDVDTVHYNTVAEDPRLRGILNDEFSLPGSMHRHNADHWGGRNEEASHTSVVGILLYHYLTGDERALEVAKEVGGFFLKEPFTYTGHPDIAPQRGMANALWGSVLLYQATWDERYKDLADKLIEIFLKGQNEDGSFLENYNPINGEWFGSKNDLYMAWYDVGAFISYHELTQDEAVKEMLVKLLRYLGPRDDAPGLSILHGLAYAYRVTGDKSFMEQAEKSLTRLVSSQIRSENPVLDGLVYDKPIYHQPNIFLYTTPYVFGALEEYFYKEREHELKDSGS